MVRDPAIAVALDVILRTVFGADTPERRQEFRTAVRAFSKGFGSPAFLLLAAMKFDNDNLPPFRRFGVARRRLEELLQDAMQRARARGRRQALGAEPRRRRALRRRHADDRRRDPRQHDHRADRRARDLGRVAVLGAVLAASPAAHLDMLLDELAPLGPDADPMAWARLPLLDAVVKETLRLWPVVTDINRVLAQPMQLGEYELPAGTNIAASSAILHYDPDLYPDGETFRPERFLERRFGPHEYLPFGGGERMCPGSHFSVYELKIVLATLLTRWRYTLLDEGTMKVKRMGGMMTPTTGVRLRLDGAAEAPSLPLGARHSSDASLMLFRTASLWLAHESERAGGSRSGRA